MNSEGLLISLEGGEGSGKSTQAVLLKDCLEKKGYRVQVVAEPGETPIGKEIRTILLDNAKTEMSYRAEVFLYMAARAQLVEQVIIPALAEGKVIISDRYQDSSMAYQGYARGLGFATVGLLNDIATQKLNPHLTFFFDADPILALQRKYANSPDKMDRLESLPLDFHQKVREGYIELAQLYPERIKMIPAGLPVKTVSEMLIKELEAFLLSR